MFQSGQYQSRPDLAWQGNLVIFLVFIILFSSLGYYILVFVNELAPLFFAKWCGRCFLRYQGENSREGKEKLEENELILSSNPLFAATGPIGDKSILLKREIETSKSLLSLAKRQNDELKRLHEELSHGGDEANMISTSNPALVQ